MTLDELKAWIQSEMQEIKDITSDSENSSRYQHLIGEYRALRRVLSRIEKLESAPVYRYLPKVPQDGEVVIGYCERFQRGMTCQFKDGKWYDLEIVEVPQGLYAWTRIPQKPPQQPPSDD